MRIFFPFILGFAFLILLLGTHPWNSDLFYLESLIRDFKSGLYPLNEFHYSASTFTIPDLPLFGFFRMFTSHLNWVLLAYMSVVLVMFIQLFRSWLGRLPGAAVAFAVFIFFGFFDHAWYSIFFPVYHGGQWLLGTLLLFYFGPHREGNLKSVALSGVLAAVMAGSDLLYGVNGLAPYCLYLVTTWLFDGRRKKIFKDLLWSMSVFVLVFLFYFAYRKFTGAYFGWNKPVFHDWGRARAFLNEFTRADPLSLLVWGGLLILGVKFKKDAISRYLLFAVLLSAISIVLTGVWANHDNVRYLFPLPVAVSYAWITFVYALDLRRLIKISLVSTVAFALLFRMADLVRLQRENPFQHPYLSSNACMDEFAKSSGFREGIGDYWSAKWISFLSRESVKVLQVNESLQPHYWINNHEWYRDFHPRFAVVGFDTKGELKPESLVSLGKPTQVTDCGRFQIWVYPEGTALLRDLSSDRKYKSFHEFR
jgi:hypothetical protein